MGVVAGVTMKLRAGAADESRSTEVVAILPIAIIAQAALVLRPLLVLVRTIVAAGRSLLIMIILADELSGRKLVEISVWGRRFLILSRCVESWDSERKWVCGMPGVRDAREAELFGSMCEGDEYVA